MIQKLKRLREETKDLFVFASLLKVTSLEFEITHEYFDMVFNSFTKDLKFIDSITSVCDNFNIEIKIKKNNDFDSIHIEDDFVKFSDSIKWDSIDAIVAEFESALKIIRHQIFYYFENNQDKIFNIT